jgi:anthranilate synthase component 1
LFLTISRKQKAVQGSTAFFIFGNQILLNPPFAKGEATKVENMYKPSFEEFKELSKRGNLVPVYREILADEETPVTALLKIRKRPYAFLLESVEGGEKWGRYTFLGADPLAVVRVKPEEVQVRSNGHLMQLPHGGDPLAVLKELLGRYRPVTVSGLPRFSGGAVGFLSYDMVRYFEKRLAKSPRGERDIDDAVFMVTDTLIIFDNVRHTIKVVASARCDEGPGCLEGAYAEATAKIDGMIAQLQEPIKPLLLRSGDFRRGVEFESNMTPEAFQEMVRRAKEYIGAGDIIQAVLSQRFSANNPLDPVDLYRALRFVNPSPYLFFLKMEDVHLIGSSPEVMVRVEDGFAELRPIAGTRRRGETEQEDRALADELLEDPKERAEHVMLVDLGRNDLGRIAAIGTVQVSQYMIVERYSHVMHLVSNVRAQLAGGKDCFDVMRACFPAGTLSGAPKVRAMEIIGELEPARRGPYGGAVGYLSFTGNMDFCITIRTMILRGETLSIQAGAGIVADSDPATEYEETLNKAAGMVKAVRLAARGFELSED